MDIKQELDGIVAKLQPLALPMVKITPTTQPIKHPWSSKFGGDPYWLKDADYPHTSDEEPLFLIAQINFAEIPPLEGYPTRGLLQFFVADDDLFGMDFDSELEEVLQAPDGYRVVYHKEIIEDDEKLLKEFPKMDEDDSYLPIDREYSLSFELSEEIASPTDCTFYNTIGDIYKMDDEISDYLCDNLSNEGSKIGGYANFTQDDPRQYLEEAKKTDSTTKWLLLFQMDTEWNDDIKIMWGDAGVANFFIEADMLAKLDFSRVWYNWDCC